MAEELKVRTERIDDIPLLISFQEQMGISRLIDKHFIPHGNWQGASLGLVAVFWLSFILSQCDHRKNRVRPWVEKRQEFLTHLLGDGWTPNDLNDDRLAILLRYLSQDEPWEKLEGELNRHTMLVYSLEEQPVRLDSTTANGHWQVTEDGLFQFGHSKDHRPDLPQIKVMMSTLDPLGMPLVTTILPGNRADDPLYVPDIQKVKKSLKQRGLLYVGDSKMSAIETRAFLQKGGDFYLCPLSLIQLPEETLKTTLKTLWESEAERVEVKRENNKGQEETIAEGYEEEVELSHEVKGKKLRWKERRFFVRSFALAKKKETELRQKVKKVQGEIVNLNERKRGKKRCQDVDELQQQVEAILAKNKVTDFFTLRYEEKLNERHVRGYKGKPERVEVEREVKVISHIEEERLEEAMTLLGWRVYATNALKEKLSLAEGVICYRSSQRIEGGFGRLKNYPLSLLPSYLEREDHVKGLVRLLSLGLRVLTLLEFVVRRELAQQKEEISGLYPGNPKRSTTRPSTELLLHAFEELTLTFLTGSLNTIHLTPLSPVQKRIMELLGLPLEIYLPSRYG